MRRAMSRFISEKKTRPPEAPAASFRVDHASVEDFYIQLENPHKSWLPGDELKGQVILVSKKNLANVSIVFSLTGYIKLNASPQSKMRPAKHVLFKHTINIYGPEQAAPGPDFANGLYSGEHRFPFVVKLPNKRIFTSIDFGKGAIVYVLSTRLRSSDPGESAPPQESTPSPDSSLFGTKALARLQNRTLTYEKTISLVNPIDVAGLPPPKRKCLIIVDPRKGKLSRVQSSSSTINTYASMSSNNSDSESVSSHRPFSSACASNATSNACTPTSADQASPAAKSPASTDKPNTIRVSMEISQRGYLRGELIPIKLSIHHLKKIQDTRGIIVTLVRVCRIDHGPDAYFESFRKDLQQSVIPLFVDPSTLSSEISTSVRVPLDAFPTISGCPIVTFHYFIEVMLNLSGKSLTLEAPSEDPKMALVPEDGTAGQSPGANVTSGNYSFHSYAQQRSEYINTDKFKRSKKFLQLTSEIVIGTHRSTKPSTVASSPENIATSPGTARDCADLNPGQSPAGPEQPAYSSQSFHGQSLQNQGLPNSETQAPEPAPNPIPPYVYASEQSAIPTYEDITVPTPAVPALTEKDRMRMHEASLLPSEPQFDSGSDDDASRHSNDFFNDPIPEPMSEPDAFPPHTLAEDELYETPNIHEGIGSEGASDYVPNYNSAANDVLVENPKP